MTPLNEIFDQVVADALETLPEEFISRLENIEIVIEDSPPSKLHGKDRNCLLLGLYEGIPITERSHYYGGVLPDKITIFKNSILKISRTREEAIENIRKTFLHELGHYFGIDDKRLRELGY